MGRSVMTQAGAVEVLYFVLPDIDDLRDERVEQAGDFGETEEEIRSWPDDVWYDDLQWAFDDLVEGVRHSLSSAFPSFSDEDMWPDREVHTIARSTFTDVSVAEYCGLVSVSITPRNVCDYCYRPCTCVTTNNLATAWTNRMAGRIADVVREGVHLDEYGLLGRFSNGEAIYEKRGA